MKHAIITLSILLLLPVLIMSYPVDITVGGRAGAMGGAFTSIADDGLAIYYNPAGLFDIRSEELTIMHQRYTMIEGLSTTWMSAGYKINDRIGVGVYWLNNLATLEEGNAYTNISSSTMSENHLAVGAGLKLLNSLGIGMSIQRYSIYSSLDGKSGLGMNAGIIGAFKGLRIGVSVKNLLAGMSDESYSPDYRLGLSYTAFPIIEETIYTKVVDGEKKKYLRRDEKGYRLAFAFDIMYKTGAVQYTADSENILNYYGGIEYTPFEAISMRAGYNTQDGITGGLRLGYDRYFIDVTYMNGIDDPVMGIPIIGPTYQVAFVFKL